MRHGVTRRDAKHDARKNEPEKKSAVGMERRFPARGCTDRPTTPTRVRGCLQQQRRGGGGAKIMGGLGERDGERGVRGAFLYAVEAIGRGLAASTI